MGVVVAGWPASEPCMLPPTAGMPRCARPPAPTGCVACSGPIPASRSSAGATKELPNSMYMFDQGFTRYRVFGSGRDPAGWCL